MAENTMEIIIEAVDRATAELKKVKESVNDVEKSTKEVSKTTEKAGQTIENSFKQAGKEIKDFRRSVFVLTATIATIMQLTSEWGKKNQETHEAINSIKSDISILVSNLGSLLAPAIIGISQAIKAITPALNDFFDVARNGFNKLNSWITFGTQYWVAYFSALKTGVTTNEAMAIAMNVAGEAAKYATDNFNAAFSENNTAKVNDLEARINSLGETWVSWEDEKTQSSMVALTTQAAAMQQSISAYEQYYSTIGAMESLANDTSLQLLMRHSAQVKEQYESLKNRVTMTFKQMVTVFQSSLQELQTALEGAAELNKGFAKAAAAIALSLAIVHTAEGVTRAYSDYPWPFSMVVAGIIAAAGAIQIATIAATKFHSGGLIKAHDGLAVDEVPIIAQTGEGVLSRRGMSTLGGAGVLNRLNSGYGAGVSLTVQNYIYNPTIREDSDIDKLTEEISLRLAREAERI